MMIPLQTPKRVQGELLPAQTQNHREHLYGDCDITITVKGHSFHAHREVLIEHSKYFLIMLTQFEEKDKTEVEIKELFEPEIMGLALHYMYFNSIAIQVSNVQDLLQISTYLQMEALQSSFILCKLVRTIYIYT